MSGDETKFCVLCRSGEHTPEQHRAGRSPVADLMTREQRIAERTRDLLAEIVDVPSDPYPASVGEVADEIARYVLELDDAGTARGLADAVLEALYRGAVEAGRERAAQDAAQVLATVTNECHCSRTERVYCHSTKCHGGADILAAEAHQNDPDASAPDADPDYRHFH